MLYIGLVHRATGKSIRSTLVVRFILSHHETFSANHSKLAEKLSNCPITEVHRIVRIKSILRFILKNGLRTTYGEFHNFPPYTTSENCLVEWYCNTHTPIWRTHFLSIKHSLIITMHTIKIWWKNRNFTYIFFTTSHGAQLDNVEKIARNSIEVALSRECWFNALFFFFTAIATYSYRYSKMNWTWYLLCLSSTHTQRGPTGNYLRDFLTGYEAAVTCFMIAYHWSRRQPIKIHGDWEYQRGEPHCDKMGVIQCVFRRGSQMWIWRELYLKICRITHTKLYKS